MINTTTRSLLEIPAFDLNTPEQLEIDLARLAIWRCNEALRKLENKHGTSNTAK